MFKHARILLLASCVMIHGCGHDKSATEHDSAQQLYDQAAEQMGKKKYRRALEHFEELERLYPYDDLSIRSELMRAYAYYKDEEYEDAVIAIERFVKLHPGNKDIDYAYYLKAMAYYEQISTVTRDQGFTEKAYYALKEVVTRYSASEYARDAQIKLDLVVDHLAGKELDIGRFYLKKGKYIAAINRFQEVVAKYDTTSHIPEALHRLVEAYTALGVSKEAKKYAAVLGYNYPGSKWYQYSYELIEGKVPSKEISKAEEESTLKSWWQLDMPFSDKKDKLESKKDAKAPPSDTQPRSFDRDIEAEPLSDAEPTILPEALPTESDILPTPLSDKPVDPVKSPETAQ